MKNKKITKRLLSKHENPALRSTKMRKMRTVYEVEFNTDLGTSVVNEPAFEIDRSSVM